jgi:hypothetical protein
MRHGWADFVPECTPDEREKWRRNAKLGRKAWIVPPQRNGRRLHRLPGDITLSHTKKRGKTKLWIANVYAIDGKKIIPAFQSKVEM